MKRAKFFLLYFNEPKIIAAGFIFFVACILFLWQILSGFQSAEKINIIPSPNFTGNQESLHLNSPLFTTALFGDYVPTNLSDADIKQSMLDVEVVGIMFANKEEDSQVIIRAGGGEEKTYFIGDSLPGGAIIKRISKEGVVVLHNGALESLSLPKNELIFEAPAKPLIEE